jgi:hypothetical protein
MVTVPFKGKLRKVGSSYVVTVPMDFMKYGMLWEGEEFDIKVETPE